MNGIVIIAPNKLDMLKVCLPSVEHFAKKYNVDVQAVTKEEYFLPKVSGYNFKIFEKFQAQHFTDKYDRMIRMDVDIVFNPDCPNIFDEFEPGKVWGVFEDSGNRRRDRRRQIVHIQETMGRIEPRWSKGYFNAGVILTDKKHSPLYEVSREELNLHIKKRLGRFKEQNTMNWRARNLGYEIDNMRYRYNHMSKNTDSGHRQKDSYVIHFAGKQSSKLSKMRELYKYWYG